MWVISGRVMFCFWMNTAKICSRQVFLVCVLECQYGSELAGPFLDPPE